MGMTMGQLAATPPTFGVNGGDFAKRGGNAPIPMQQPQSTLVAAASVGDLASTRVQVDTSAPLTGCLIGIAVLVGIRLWWELADDD